MTSFLRSVVRAAAATLLFAGIHPAAAADPIGAVGDESIMSAIQRLSSIREGTSGPAIFILFAATCDKSVSMKSVVGGSITPLQVHWVPAPADGGRADPITARLVGADLAGLDLALKGDTSRLHEAGTEAERQSWEIATNLWRPMFRATGRPLATPTLVYRDPEGHVRVVRGSVGEDLFARIATDAR